MGGRRAVVSVRTRDVYGVDRQCGQAVRKLMMRLVEEGLAGRHKQVVYLIERRAVEEVLSALRGGYDGDSQESQNRSLRF
jgi:hypothetical protein